MQFLSAHLSEFLSFIAGMVGGSLITLKVTRAHRADRHGSVVDQTRARAGGDIVGRDKTG
jgi:hypothetical protein